MRTVILVTGWAIANAINGNWLSGDEIGIKFYAWIFVISAVMDITDFIKKQISK